MRGLCPSPRWLVVVLIAAFAVGCKKKNPNPETAGPAPPREHVGPPLTEGDYRQFGQKLETAVAEGNKAEVDRLIRTLDVIERSISDLILTPSERREVLAGASLAVQEFGPLFSQECIDVVQNGGSYTFLRVRKVDGRLRALLRLAHAEDALAYHEFSLVRYPDGQVATEDVYIYASGEPLTQTYRRALLGLVPELNRGGLSRLSKKEQLLVRHRNDLVRMSHQQLSGQHREALATFRQLPAELQKNKLFQLMALHAAQASGDEAEYLAELERFRRDYPNDPVADLMSIDYYMITKQYDEAVKAIERLDEAVGGDPYLDVQRAGQLMEAGRYKEARAAAEKAIKEAPKMPQGHWARVVIAAKEMNHADTLAWLKKLAEVVDHTVEPADLEADERFTEFVKTPQFAEFKQWLAARKK